MDIKKKSVTWAFLCGITAAIVAHIAAQIVLVTTERLSHFVGHVAGVLIYEVLSHLLG